MTSPNELRDRAVEAHHAGRFMEAETCYRELLSTHPHPGLLNNLGMVLVAQRRYIEAVPFFERSIELRPADANTRVALANALIFANRPDDALRHCDAVLVTDGANEDARHNRAVALRALNRHAEAIDELEGLLARNPADADAEWNLALSELTLGRHAEGWRHYEARWRGRHPNPPLPMPNIPSWRPGDSLAGKSILVQAEQGLGDTLHFVRWISLLQRQCQRVELQVQSSLCGLLARHFRELAVSTLGAPLQGPVDLRLPMMSLPLALGLDGGALFEPAFRLEAGDGERLDKWRAQLPGNPRRWAIAWRGSPAHRHDSQRSLALGRLRPLLDATRLAGIDLLAVQRDLQSEERRLLESQPHVRVLDEQLRDFEETAAVLSLVERVITVDTAVAHLAGALGVPTTVLLAFSADFRWGAQGDSTRFYPSLRLLRQRSPGAWDEVIQSLASAIP